MKGSHSEAIKEIRRKSKTFSDSKVKMFPDHVKVIGDGAFFSQLMQMKDGYLDGHEGEWFTTPEVSAGMLYEHEDKPHRSQRQQCGNTGWRDSRSTSTLTETSPCSLSWISWRP